MKRAVACVACLLVLCAAPAGAAELRVRVVDARGEPVADAVVALAPVAGSGSAPDREVPARTRTIDQVDETFVPYVEVFRPGDSVVFRNSDATRHHVYSFAPASAFELVLAPGESSAPMTLERSGAVAVGCNIHDRMITHLYVADAPWLARTGAEGSATMQALAPGEYRLTLWHPLLRRPADAHERSLRIGEDEAVHELELPLSLLPDPRAPRGRERIDY